MWWLVSRVQLAREVVVDELAVLATGRRRAYIEALVAFADEPSLVPVAAFGSRRQLFNRIVLLSKEGVMSSHRLVVTCGVMAAVLMVGSWKAVRAFPLSASPDAQVVQHKAPGPVEQRANPITPENPIPRRVMFEPPVFPAEARGAFARGAVTLMITLDELGRVVEARRIQVALTSGVVVDADEQSLSVRVITAALTDAAVRAVGQWRYDPPAAGPISFPVTVSFAENGDAAAVQPATVKEDPGPAWSNGAMRVGGNIRPPLKTRDVRPVYPPLAMQARVSGLVLVEAQIGTNGAVEDARILKSVPLLDQAALDAVRQWRFTPTLLNGRPVPVIVTLTVRFVLDSPDEVSDTVRNTGQGPLVVKEVKPLYPLEALRSGAEGTVEVEITIGTDGKVQDSRILRSVPMLDEAALDAARQWEFVPPPRVTVTTIELTFRTRRNRGVD